MIKGSTHPSTVYKEWKLKARG